MKRFAVLLMCSLSLTFYGQREKIRGSKIVIIEAKEIGDFETVEVTDNLEISLEKGPKCGIKVEADDNLQDVITLTLIGTDLKISTSKEILTYKKLNVRVIYTDSLRKVVSKDKAIIKAIEPLMLKDITFDATDKSELYLNSRVTNFNITLSKKAIAEINNTSQKTTIVMSDATAMKALVSTTDLKLDMYQKTNASVEGDAVGSIIRLDNNSILRGKNLISKGIDLLVEGDSFCEIHAITNLSIAATDKSEVNLFGEPQIIVTKFTGETRLVKKIIK